MRLITHLTPLLAAASTVDAFLLLRPHAVTIRSSTSSCCTSRQEQGLPCSLQRAVKILLAKEDGGDAKDSSAPSGSSSSSSSKSDPPVTGVPAPPEPFLPALDPKYMCEGEIGQGEFVITREGGPVEEELSNENLLRILRIECTDLEVNTLVWKCLGYRFDPDAKEWTDVECFPKWREKYPNTPPDLIGMSRIYSKEQDQPSLKANQALVRSVPADNKQSLKTQLKPYGFTGYQYRELTPNKTRRAQCANWLLYYREELFGYTVEELRERRRLKLEAEKRQQEEEEGNKGDEWKPPVKEVF
mmetsp:Transcript_37791/g.82810  ORF Transcript_37791/g.82810 Transcript_37791/m.82810 type:complete len:301 (+) Transcript_37791:162-1064(+)